MDWDRFVVLPENRFAWELCRRVAHDEDGLATPLFLFGPTGVGKTHLTRALALEAAARTRRPRIACMTARDYAEEAAQAARSDDFPAMLARYSRLDLLVLDGIEGMGGKAWLQPVLHPTIAGLCTRRVPVVMTARSAPGKLEGFSTRMRSYWASGLIASIALPGERSRQTFLQAISEQQRLSLPPEACKVLAKGVPGSPRRLIETVTLLGAVAKENNRPVTRELAQRYIALTEREFDAESLTRITQTVATDMGLSFLELVSAQRSRPITRGRQVAIYLVRELTHHSLVEIGRFFGGRDHSTVMHACRRVEQIRREDQVFNATVSRLREELRGVT